MLKRNAVLALAAVVLLGACTGIQTTRNTPIDVLPTAIGIKSSPGDSWHVQKVNVIVPDSLKVSEANSYIPRGDIIWRGDPYGDRRAQVKAILENSISQAFLDMQGPEAVIVDVTLIRFHALSQRARATVGGVHNVKFDVTVRDAQTGAQLIDDFEVNASLRAYGGMRAIRAEMKGQTQKVRISQHITKVMKQYFSL